MNVSAIRNRLEMLTRELSRNWEDTRPSWRDAKAQEFEQRYLQELSAQVDKTGTAIEKLDELLNRVRGDCE
jgi:hypothetical protein